MIVLETLAFLVIGFILTDKILKTIYENFGIRFTGMYGLIGSLYHTYYFFFIHSFVGSSLTSNTTFLRNVYQLLSFGFF